MQSTYRNQNKGLVEDTRDKLLNIFSAFLFLLRTLVAETLVLAKTHGYVEKIENKLEEELARDISDPTDENVLRWRRGGDRVFKSKQMLLTVVILCIVDCALVLGELALDLYKVKATLEASNDLTIATKAFIVEMETANPNVQDFSPFRIFTLLLGSVIIWPTSLNLTTTPNRTIVQNKTITDIHLTGYPVCVAQPHTDKNDSLPVFDNEFNEDYSDDNIDIIGDIAHIFHYCSIAILAVLMIETIMKAVCAGKDFFHRKLEVFDAFIVVMSFLVDFCFLVFLPDIDIQDFVFILAILLPWRVIRVVNSLVVSVKDHEHFRLKLVYKRKKKIQGNLRDTESMLSKYMSQVATLQRLCIMEGIDEWKVDNYLKLDSSMPHTPTKKKFKFKLDDSIFHMQGHNRAPRCSMPSLNFHGLKLPSNGNVSKSRISLPSVAHSIKQHISKNLPSRRASLAAIEMSNTKSNAQNGDLRRKKIMSEELSTMHEEEDFDHENKDSAVSSRATSESGDVFSRISVSDSTGSDNIFPENKLKSRTNSDDAESEKDERAKIAKIQEEAKRRHSESNIDKNRIKFIVTDYSDLMKYAPKDWKSYTKPESNRDKIKRSHSSLNDDNIENYMSNTSANSKNDFTAKAEHLSSNNSTNAIEHPDAIISKHETNLDQVKNEHITNEDKRGKTEKVDTVIVINSNEQT